MPKLQRPSKKSVRPKRAQLQAEEEAHVAAKKARLEEEAREQEHTFKEVRQAAEA